MKTYKSIIKTAALSLLALWTTGCSDYLDKEPDDQLTMDMVFSDRTRTEDWLAGCYSSIPNPFWGYMKGSTDDGYVCTGMGNNTMSDDITIPQQWSPYGWAQVYAYTVGNWNPSYAWKSNPWTEYPKRIRAALIYQQQIHVIPGTQLTEDYVERSKYEARFLVAYYYSLLLQYFGPFPFNPGVIYDTDASNDEMMRTQTPYQTIVDWCDAEFLEVSKHLPAVYENNSDWGRATSIAALAMRAKMLLFAASPLFNGNPTFANWKNADGVNLFDATADPSKWKRAADAYKDLITAAENAGYGLYYEYNKDGSIDPFMSCYNVNLVSWPTNKEILWGVSLYNNNLDDLYNWQNHHLPRSIGGNAGMDVTQELVDAFFMKNGESPITGYTENADGSRTPIINPASGYVEKGFSTDVEMRETQWKGGGPSSLFDDANGMRPVTDKGTFNMYCNREPRFYVSVIYNKAWLNVVNRKVDYLYGGADTYTTFDTPGNGYNVRKMVSLDVYPTNNLHNYQPGILYRMANAYLDYAEALNESQAAPDATVYHYVNLIRERAGIPDLPAGMTQDEMREALRKERRVEFNCEGIRIDDLRRWKLCDKYLNVNLGGMTHLGTKESDDPTDPTAFYVRQWCGRTRVFTEKMYLWPIPQAQIDINPKLVQAPGYDLSTSSSTTTNP
ncbi:MAG: RagB/SusD family nutrient uptake outer membrane protein [Mediterranea sp.]|jgi:hypothetical protein|nr:RagB/SusD family nutrient uptake outer membrane protein [Mediterranea sp.]